MKAVIQRVSHARVAIEGNIVGQIEQGLLVLLGITHSDTEQEAAWIAKKICQMRIFSDENGNMNLSVQDIGGEVLLVSQFTLYAQAHKGNRPSFIDAAPPLLADTLYQKTIAKIESLMGKKIATGIFGANMQISLLNDGPVTIVLEK